MWFKITCCLICLILVDCARILVVLPTPSFSHQLFYRAIYKHLAFRGHQLVVFTTDPINLQLQNLIEIDLHYFYEHASKVNFGNLYEDMYKIEIIYKFQKEFGVIVDKTFSHHEMKKLISNRTEYFDLVIIEWCTNPSLAMLSKRFEAPLIGLRSLGLRIEGQDAIGNPTNPSYIPVAYMDFKENFWGRLDNFCFSVLWRLQHQIFTIPLAQRIVERHFPDIKCDINDIEKNVSLVITNTHPILTRSRPLVPSIIEVAGAHLRQEMQNISEDIMEFLDNGREGVIYFNLGTNVKSSQLQSKFINLISSALQKVPFKVLWKWENNKLTVKSKNIKTAKWLPQERVLGMFLKKFNEIKDNIEKLVAHPNVKLFITHGGLLSFQEAIDNHVPLIGIPFFADQHVNVRRMVELGIGKYLDIETLTENEIIVSIYNVIKNDSYKRNIKHISTLLKDRNFQPIDKAIWWIEYVIRNRGSPYFKTAGVEMNWTEYLLLDVLVFLLVCCIFIYMLGYCIIHFILYVRSNGNNNQLKKYN